DTNHQILDLIIENITGELVNIVLKNLFQELNLTKTYVCEYAMYSPEKISHQISLWNFNSEHEIKQEKHSLYNQT
ncbi:MAG: hypothetical protein LWX51_18270, partial [Deltaproteobacteria bacterium]|nr:hypothetical protein [Deltaproteobacteria bacterium]